MNVGFKNVANSWLQFLVALLFAALFVLVGYLISSLIIDSVGDDWYDEFFKYLVMAGWSGAILHFITIFLFAFLDNGNKRTTWYVMLMVHILAGVSWFIAFFVQNSEYNDEISAVIITCLIFVFMYLLSYLVSTIFMPKTYRFANPIASKIFM